MVWAAVAPIPDVGVGLAARALPLRQGPARPLLPRGVVHAGAPLLRRRRHHLDVGLQLRVGRDQRAPAGGRPRRGWPTRGSATRRRRCGRSCSPTSWKWTGFNMVVCLAALYALPDRDPGGGGPRQLRLAPPARLRHDPDDVAHAAQPPDPVVHRQDAGVRPRLDHDAGAARSGRPRPSRRTSTSGPSSGTPSTSATPRRSPPSGSWWCSPSRWVSGGSSASATGWSTSRAPRRRRQADRAPDAPSPSTRRWRGRRSCGSPSCRSGRPPRSRPRPSAGRRPPTGGSTRRCGRPRTTTRTSGTAR